MQDNIKITVVTVCFNAVKDIEGTILSVINQTYDNIEYIIIDGSSSDGTIDIIKKYTEGGTEFGKHNHKISYWVSEPDKGIYDAMNKGIDAATGDYINFMNAGDTFYNGEVIKKVVEYLKGSFFDIIYGDCNHINYKRSSLPIIRKASDINVIIKRCPMCHQATFIKLQFHKKHHYDTSFKICADWKLLRDAYIIFKCKFLQINNIICNFDCKGGMSKDHIYRLYHERYRILNVKKMSTKRFIGNFIMILVIIKKKIFNFFGNKSH